MGKFDGSITSSECGKYSIQANNNSTPDVLVIIKIVADNHGNFTTEPVVTTDIIQPNAVYLFNTDETVAYVLHWESDPSDTIAIVNTCKIDVCVLNYISRLINCNECLDCGSSCIKFEWLGKFIAIDTLYRVLLDLNKDDGTNDFATLCKITSLLNKINDLCTCSTCE